MERLRKLEAAFVTHPRFIEAPPHSTNKAYSQKLSELSLETQDILITALRWLIRGRDPMECLPMRFWELTHQQKLAKTMTAATASLKSIMQIKLRKLLLRLVVIPSMSQGRPLNLSTTLFVILCHQKMMNALPQLK